MNLKRVGLATFVVLISGACGRPGLDRTKAAVILEAQPWNDGQWLVVRREQMDCGVNAGLWTFDPGSVGIRASWDPTAKGKQQLGLGHVTDFRAERLSVFRWAGFPVKASITGIATDAAGGRSHAEASLFAKIDHPCFADGLPFAADARGTVDGAKTVAFALFDDGWRLAPAQE